MPDRWRRGRALVVAVLCLAGAARAQPGLRPLSDAEIQRRFDNTWLDGSAPPRFFLPSGRYEEQQRMPRHGRYWAEASRLCTQFLDLGAPSAPTCTPVLTDADGTLYFGSVQGGRPEKIFLKPNP
jgi:hypothetical protein